MNFSKHFIFLAVAILCVFSRQSEAGAIGAIFGTLANAVGSGVSAFFETVADAIAEVKKHKDYNRAKADIQKLASQANDNDSNGLLLERTFEIIDILKSSIDSALNAVEKADASSEDVNKSFVEPNELIVLAGAEFYHLYGNLTLLNPYATQGLTEATQTVTVGGALSFKLYDASRDIIIDGNAAGPDVADQAKIAACKTIQVIEKAILNLIIKATDIAFAALDRKSLPFEITAEDIAAKDAAAASSPKSQNAIEAIVNLANTALSQVTSEDKQTSIQIIRNANIDAIKTIALAGKPGYKAMDDGKTISNRQLAQETIEKGISETKYECSIATATAQQGLGAAGALLPPGLKENITQAMIRVELIRQSLMKELDYALLVAKEGINNNASKVACSAGHDIVAAAGFGSYGRFVAESSGVFTLIVSA